MRHGWMLEVLEDLRNYADKNDLIAAWEALSLTSTVVNAELLGHVSEAPVQMFKNTPGVPLSQPVIPPVKYQT